MRLVNRTLGCAFALAFAACGVSDQVAAPPATFEDFGVQAPSTAPVMPLTRLVVPTYDGSGQAVHPDVLWFPSGWHGFEYWMAFTPFPGGKPEFENPSIVVSHDGIAWQVPPGLSNPVVRRPPKGSYNSDPDLSYDSATDQLVLLTREVRGGFNHVSLLASKDGVKWTGLRKVFLRRNHGMISPAMVLSPSRDPRLWFVDGGDKKCPKRVTRVMRQEGIGRSPLANPALERGWGPARASGLAQPGYLIWHIDVAWVAARKEYWAVYPAYQRRDCGARDLFFARSPDGVRWTTYPVPLLRHEDKNWTSAMLYRATTLYDAGRDVIRIYLSASAPGPEWRLGVVEFRMSELLARLAGTNADRSPATPTTETGNADQEDPLP
jgi:hypothetical protein